VSLKFKVAVQLLLDENFSSLFRTFFVTCLFLSVCLSFFVLLVFCLLPSLNVLLVFRAFVRSFVSLLVRLLACLFDLSPVCL